MKKIGIIAALFTMILVLTGCTSNEISFIDCIYDSTCNQSTLIAKNNPDDEFILYANGFAEEELNVDFLFPETHIFYDEYDPSNLSITIQLFERKGVPSNFSIASFDNYFAKISQYLSGKSIECDYLKVEIKTNGSFERKSIALKDNLKSYSSIYTNYNTYDNLSNNEKSKIIDDISNYSDFDRFSYNFMYNDISILLNQSSNDEQSISISIVHRDPEEDFYIPRDKIFEVYETLLSDTVTLVLEEED